MFFDLLAFLNSFEILSQRDNEALLWTIFFFWGEYVETADIRGAKN